jgi:transporter family protein
MNWMICALLSAFFAGVTALLAKLGVADVPSNLATFIRTVVVVLFSLAIVIAQGQLQSVPELSPRAWTFLVLSGIATGLSWLFYFAALKYGPLSGVAPIDKLSFVLAMVFGALVLGEKLDGLTIAGGVLIGAGVLLTLPPIQEFIHSKIF